MNFVDLLHQSLNVNRWFSLTYPLIDKRFSIFIPSYSISLVHCSSQLAEEIDESFSSLFREFLEFLVTKKTERMIPLGIGSIY